MILAQRLGLRQPPSSGAAKPGPGRGGLSRKGRGFIEISLEFAGDMDHSIEWRGGGSPAPAGGSQASILPGGTSTMGAPMVRKGADATRFRTRPAIMGKNIYV